MLLLLMKSLRTQQKLNDCQSKLLQKNSYKIVLIQTVILNSYDINNDVDLLTKFSNLQVLNFDDVNIQILYRENTTSYQT